VRPSFHLVPASTWAARPTAVPYAPASLDVEGFVHCTDGEDEVLRTGDRYYRDEPGDWLVLTIDLDATGAPWTIDDPAGHFPHVHGPIPASAVLDVRPIVRGVNGRFVAIGAGGDHGGGGTGSVG
jgi:uncharacterized protein (DUF952 family)